ncbi:MAG: twin-arginine translocase TatA/TatE family subunit [Flavobacteriales bacterium]|nr:twin-arginine translocase TatA/TatE family subunit [Flavobacteriales bacterium]|tara:strand:- start:2788 stop:2988 length:201 start_codon:yes stop_codon:yes gene_type:complete
MFLFIGGSEIIIILFFIIVFFGANKIPSLARSAGKVIREIQDASDDVRKEIQKNSSDIKDDFDIKK